MANAVREVREALGLTQVQMAERLGCGETSLRRFEREGTLPTVKAVLKNLQRLAKQAGIELPEDGK